MTTENSGKLEEKAFEGGLYNKVLEFIKMNKGLYFLKEESRSPEGIFYRETLINPNNGNNSSFYDFKPYGPKLVRGVGGRGKRKI